LHHKSTHRNPNNMVKDVAKDRQDVKGVAAVAAIRNERSDIYPPPPRGVDAPVVGESATDTDTTLYHDEHSDLCTDPPREYNGDDDEDDEAAFPNKNGDQSRGDVGAVAVVATVPPPMAVAVANRDDTQVPRLHNGRVVDCKNTLQSYSIARNSNNTSARSSSNNTVIATPLVFADAYHAPPPHHYPYPYHAKEGAVVHQGQPPATKFAAPPVADSSATVSVPTTAAATTSTVTTSTKATNASDKKPT
jgi:hypothetical protein